MRNLLLTLLLLFVVTQLTAQHSLTGTITDSNGEPIPAVSVILAGADEATATDADGFFMFRRLQNQDYIVQIDADGFKKASQTINIKGRTSADFEMKSNCWYYWIRFKKCR